MSYARNYLCTIPELPSADKDSVVKEIADKVEKDLEDVTFDQRPTSSVCCGAEGERQDSGRSRKEVYQIESISLAVVGING